MENRAAPETDRALLERCAVAEPRMRQRLLQSLADLRETLALHASGPDGEPLVVEATAIEVDTERGTLDLELPPATDLLEGLRTAGTLTAVALPGHAKLQFALAAYVIVADAQSARLRAPLPEQVVRIQRREAFRVEPKVQAAPRLTITWRGVTHKVRVLDLSATGIAFEVSATAALPEIGSLLEACRMELPATPPIRCNMVVRGLSRTFGNTDGGCRVGCEFVGLDPTAERALQVFVNEEQVRGRRARPSIG